MLEKKSYAVVCRVKQIISNQITHTPSPLPTTCPDSKFYNNWANPRALIGRELCSMEQRKLPRRLLKVSGF